MKELETDIRRLPTVNISNVWLLTDSHGRRFLIDTGDRLERPLVLAGLWAAGVAGPGDLTAVLLTHRHRDHAGNAAWLREKFACPVLAHANDAPYLEGDRKPAPLAGRQTPPLERALCWLEDLRPARTIVDEVYEEGKPRWGFEAIPAFGHSEGSVMLYHRPSRTLFSGDAVLVGIPPLGWRPELRLAMPEFSPDAESCHRAVRRFVAAAPRIERLCAGHGPMMSEQVERKLRALAAAPEDGRWLFQQALDAGWGMLPRFS
jgi:glyoxylase-like metal-dependent hydrolase (beta-lactamase superfamily II)